MRHFTNGNVVYMPLTFTTKAHERAAVRLMVQDANDVAKELNLPENLPITESNTEPHPRIMLVGGDTVWVERATCPLRSGDALVAALSRSK